MSKPIERMTKPELVMQIRRLQTVIRQIGLVELSCPKCGNPDITLGTQNAYSCCPQCGGGYWTEDGHDPREDGATWEDAVMMSPWTRPSWLKDKIRQMGGTV